jgi:hypothetical protein
MGMLDQNLILADAQAATDHTADTASTNVYDTGMSDGLGASLGLTGERLWIVATVNTAVTSAGAATVQAVLQDSADNVTFADAVAGPVVAKANAVVGAVLLEVQPPPGLRRYLRLVWRIGVADLTAGKFDGYITSSIQHNVARNSGFTVG